MLKDFAIYSGDVATARESILHVMAEMLNWANEWTKPRAGATQQK